MTPKLIAEYILIGKIPRETLKSLSFQQQYLVKTEYNKLNQQLYVQALPL